MFGRDRMSGVSCTAFVPFLFICIFLLSLLSHSLGTHARTAGLHTNKQINIHTVMVRIVHTDMLHFCHDLLDLTPASNLLYPGRYVEVDYNEDQDVIELVPNIILNPGFMESDPVRSREPYAASIIKSTECPGPGKPRRV